MNIKTAKICNIGGRKKNDDTAEISLGDGAVRVYVGDGLGSYAGGKQASETAGQALLSYRGSMLSDEALRSAAQLANQAVYTLQSNTKGTMKTTIVFLTIEQDQARWMHVGDSRLYYFRNGKLVTQTTDHSVSQMAVMMGEITTHQIRFHEDRNRVLRSLGGENAKPELSSVVDLSAGNHAFLLCSDGFWEYVYEDEMEQTLQQSRDPQEWIDRMEKILQSRITGNNDNYTAAVVFADSGVAGGIPVAAPSYAAEEGYPKASKKRSGKGRGLLIALVLLLIAAIAAAALYFVPKLTEEEVRETTAATTATTVQTAPTEAVTETVMAATTEAALQEAEETPIESTTEPSTENPLVSSAPDSSTDPSDESTDTGLDIS